MITLTPILKEKMNILVVGSGGREHAVIKKLLESKHTSKVFCAPGNGGISLDAECVDINATDIDSMVKFASTNKIDLCIVTPDDPLVLGMADAMNEAGIPAFGPSKKAAQIEGSKVFSKDLMKKYNIPTAGYDVFNDPKQALEFIEKENTYPTVIKADGLALGKGVIIAQNYDEAKAAIHSIMEDKIFGKSGNEVVIEEYLEGPEVSVLSFTDSKVLKPMVSSKDHKRAFDGNLGPNTGGMGTISPNPFYTEEIAKRCEKEIFLPTVEAMNKEGRPFKGCLYFGLMITKNGPKVIEYNCRFGDPETQVVLPRLQSDIVEIMVACIEENLSDVDIKWDDGACACVVMASGGYPVKYQKGKKITGIDLAEKLGTSVIHAGTKLCNGEFLTNGGRVLGVTAKAKTLDEALKKAYCGVEKIDFENKQFRLDIGK